MGIWQCSYRIEAGGQSELRISTARIVWQYRHAVKGRNSDVPYKGVRRADQKTTCTRAVPVKNAHRRTRIKAFANHDKKLSTVHLHVIDFAVG